MKINLPFSLFILFTFSTTTDLLAQNNGPGGDRRRGRVNGRDVDTRPRPELDASDCAQLEFQSLDGTCNNLSTDAFMELGATDVMMERIMEPEYGQSDRFNAMGGEDRPSARIVSNLIVQDQRSIFSQVGLSAMNFSWGQFIDHDITLTLESEEEEENIAVPSDDPVFTADIPFHRSEFFNERNDGLPREQLNVLTAWIDGSMVYGSEEERAEWLRTGQDGLLKTSSGNLLPFNTVDGEFSSDIDPDAPSTAGGDETTRMWVAGDVRAGEQVGLTSLHTIFVREHNRIAEDLLANGMTDDEEIYQNARKKVVALIQKITYEEFLPSLGVQLDNYSGYQTDVSPNITNEFATAGYRIGHTMVVDQVRIFDNSCQPMRDEPVSLLEAFFNPTFIMENSIEPYLRGLTVEVQQEIDPYIVPGLRDFLFTPPDAPVAAGLDLAALNIQRGRDHGLADYNSIREHYLGSRANSVADISSDSIIRNNLEAAYSDVNDIDAWIGLLSEDLLDNASMGPTLLAMMEDQFGRIRDGDRYYYESYLSGADLDDVQSTSLADVIERNSSIDGLADDVMFAQSCGVSTSIEGPVDFSTSLEIYPNPTTGIVQLSPSSERDQILTYSVVDVNGREVISTRAIESVIDLTGFPRGVYFLKFDSAEGIGVKKVVLTD